LVRAKLASSMGIVKRNVAAAKVVQWDQGDGLNKRGGSPGVGGEVGPVATAAGSDWDHGRPRPPPRQQGHGMPCPYISSTDNDGG
ncbi:MAG TPA: hypothetical protein VK208_10220, partial [Pyrinomonadaceae bacterium]|nr:hypothetical protein [Pyrinomonadaceae bacterium]